VEKRFAYFLGQFWPFLMEIFFYASNIWHFCNNKNRFEPNTKLTQPGINFSTRIPLYVFSAWLLFFWHIEIGAKVACKLLMQLTTYLGSISAKFCFKVQLCWWALFGFTNKTCTQIDQHTKLEVTPRIYTTGCAISFSTNSTRPESNCITYSSKNALLSFFLGDDPTLCVFFCTEHLF